MIDDFAAANDRVGHDSVGNEASPDWVATETERRMLEAFDDVFLADEPISDELIALAQDCYTWRTVDAELLDLLIDSAIDGLAVVRDDDRLQRFIAFGDEDRGVHFECAALDDDRFQLTGIVVPAGIYSVRVDRASADIETTTDDLGSFSLGPLVVGSIRLTIRPLDGTDPGTSAHRERDAMMVTPWFMLQP